MLSVVRLLMLLALSGCGALSPKLLIGVAPWAGEPRATDALIATLGAMPGILVVDLDRQRHAFTAWRGPKLRVELSRDATVPCMLSDVTRFEDALRTQFYRQCIARAPDESAGHFMERYADMLYRTIIDGSGIGGSRKNSASF